MILTRQATEAATVIPATGTLARAKARAEIEAEIARQGAHPIARRTLGLLAEARVELAEAPSGYRIVPWDGGADSESVAGLVTALRAKHPALFHTPEPVPEIAAPPLDSAPKPTDEIREATARFVDSRAAQARAVMARSAERGRAALAIAAAAWPARRDARKPADSAQPFVSTQPFVAPGPSPKAAVAVAAASRPAAARARRLVRGLIYLARVRASRITAWSEHCWNERIRHGWSDRGSLRETLRQPPVLIGLLALALIGVVVLGRGAGDAPNLDGAAPSGSAAVEPPSSVEPLDDGAARPGSAPSAAPKSDSPKSDSPKPDEARSADSKGSEIKSAEIKSAEVRPDAAGAGDELSGPAEVIDTATLRVGGKLIRLFGVEWVRGGQSEELSRYLAGRAVVCQPVAGSEARQCVVDGRDLSEVVLFNGGGRASSEATPELVAAEDHARTERLGVWAR